MTNRVLKETAEMLALKSVNDTLDLMPVIRKGLPSSALKAVSKRLEMTPQATGESLGMAKRTLARRLKERGPLSTEESERVVRLARTLATGQGVHPRTREYARVLHWRDATGEP